MFVCFGVQCHSTQTNSPARWRRRWERHTALKWACSRRPQRWMPWLSQPAWWRDGSRERGPIPSSLSLLLNLPPFQEVILCSSSPSHSRRIENQYCPDEKLKLLRVLWSKCPCSTPQSSSYDLCISSDLGCTFSFCLSSSSLLHLGSRKLFSNTFLSHRLCRLVDRHDCPGRPATAEQCSLFWSHSPLILTGRVFLCTWCLSPPPLQ